MAVSRSDTILEALEVFPLGELGEGHTEPLWTLLATSCESILKNKKLRKQKEMAVMRSWSGETHPYSDISWGPCLCLCSVAKSCLTLWDLMDCSAPGSSVHGILQARILEWAAISFSRGSCQPRDWTCVSCLAGGLFAIESPGNPGSLVARLLYFPACFNRRHHHHTLRSLFPKSSCMQPRTFYHT